MTRKSIQTNGPVISCDVCGRTLLRGEHADVFLHGGSRRMVCELCTARAVHEGWIREGLDDATVRARQAGGRRGSFLQRLRARRAEPQHEHEAEEQLAPARAAAGARGAWQDEPNGAGAAAAVGDGGPDGEGPFEYAPPPPEPVRHVEAHLEPERTRQPVPPREQRSVHAVPTNADLKMARALDLFNASPHRRTVSGVARSLGAPIVAVRPSPTEGSVVTIVVAWELSWYRFEVDLADEAAGVRVAGQGAELDELEPAEQDPNAAADEAGTLHLVARRA
ncbi:MAG TPA: hypothetical protein VLA98_10885 [Solirubrobacteraceae bacterium]|nr:hypothetical protein [Solirubrobacteraceae bacterium]